jgi:hypothetical protein
MENMTDFVTCKSRIHGHVWCALSSSDAEGIDIVGVRITTLNCCHLIGYEKLMDACSSSKQVHQFVATSRRSKTQPLAQQNARFSSTIRGRSPSV